MDAWVPITLTAALFQTWRTALQQRLRDQLSVAAAGFVRYIYALPAGFAFLFAWHWLAGEPIPTPNGWFLFGCLAGGLFQILATNLLIMAFGYRSFAVGTAYAKTEAVQGAVAAYLVLGEALPPLAWLGIAVGVAGVLVLSLAGRVSSLREMLAATLQPAALCGLGAGFLFAFTTVFIKAANQALHAPDLVLNALLVLVVTNVMQSLMQGGWLAMRQPAQFRAAFTTWRSSAWVGALSACGSACWFTAFAMAPVALVRVVGQFEMVFTLLFSRFFLKEALRRADFAGLVLVVAGVVLVLLSR